MIFNDNVRRPEQFEKKSSSQIKQVQRSIEMGIESPDTLGVFSIEGQTYSMNRQ